MPFGNIYQNKTVLVTGFAGFKGSWLSLWLKNLGAKVVGYSLLPDTDNRMYDVINLPELIDDYAIADIRNADKLQQFFAKHQPHIVFHLAAQPIVRLSYSEPLLTYETNVIGTLNVLEAARKTPSVKAVVNVTTDKCYENRETDIPYKEDDAFGGYDMYSSSKACSEILSASYRRSFLAQGKPFALATARAGNVIGGGDWATDRLFPDCMRAFSRGEPVFIRNPQSVRPWQWVLEPLAGYLRLGQKLYEDGEKYASGYNFGPEMDMPLTVGEVAEIAAHTWQNAEVKLGRTSDLHEANLLQLDITKAKKDLGIIPVLNAREAIIKSAQWYKAFYTTKQNMLDFSKKQIEEYITAAQNRKIAWSD